MTFGMVEDEGPACCMPTIHIWVTGDPKRGSGDSSGGTSGRRGSVERRVRIFRAVSS